MEEDNRRSFGLQQALSQRLIMMMMMMTLVYCQWCSDGNLSESEVELDGEHNEVTLPQDLSGRGNTKSAKSAIR